MVAPTCHPVSVSPSSPSLPALYLATHPTPPPPPPPLPPPGAPTIVYRLCGGPKTPRTFGWGGRREAGRRKRAASAAAHPLCAAGIRCCRKRRVCAQARRRRRSRARAWIGERSIITTFGTLAHFNRLRCMLALGLQACWSAEGTHRGQAC